MVTTVREEKLFLSPLGFSNRDLWIKVTKKIREKKDRILFLYVCRSSQKNVTQRGCYNLGLIYYLNRGRKEGEKHLWENIWLLEKIYGPQENRWERWYSFVTMSKRFLIPLQLLSEWKKSILPGAKVLGRRLTVESCFFFLINLFFNWRIIALQNFVVFCQTLTWISHMTVEFFGEALLLGRKKEFSNKHFQRGIFQTPSLWSGISKGKEELASYPWVRRCSRQRDCGQSPWGGKGFLPRI